MGKTLFEKIWDRHVATELPGGEVLLYIDRHLIHEVTSPQAFEGLVLNNRPVRHPELTFATTDHNVPTDSRSEISDPVARTQVNALETNCAQHGIRFYGMDSAKQGVVHIIGPEQVLPYPAQPSSAATRIPPHMGALVPSPLVSVHPKSSTCSPHRPCVRKNPNSTV